MTQTIQKNQPGDFNARILNQLAHSRWQRFEGCYVKVPIVLRSPDVKRLYAREFNWLQLNMMWIDKIAHEQFLESVCDRVEEAINMKMARCMEITLQAIECLQNVCAHHQIIHLVDYPDRPITTVACIISSTGKQYLNLLQKIDGMMHIVDTLAAHRKINKRQCALCKGAVRRQVKRIARTIRAWKMELEHVRTAADHAQWPRDLRGPAAREGDSALAKPDAYLRFLATLQGTF